MQNEPDPDTPDDELRWLDRLRAAWENAHASPLDESKAAALKAVADERPEEAVYRLQTFSADADLRARSTPEPKEGDQ